MNIILKALSFKIFLPLRVIPFKYLKKRKKYGRQDIYFNFLTDSTNQYYKARRIKYITKD